MKPEPLKAKGIVKKMYNPEGQYGEMNLHYDDEIELAVKGLIKFHEDRIEELIKDYKEIDEQLFNRSVLHPFKLYAWKMILKEYESITAIEHWLEDVI